MIWVMINQKIQQKELIQTRFLRDKAFKSASDPKYDGYQRGLASIVYKFFGKNSSGSGTAATEPNYQLANELHKQSITKFFKKEKFIHRLETIFVGLIQLICNH